MPDSEATQKPKQRRRRLAKGRDKLILVAMQLFAERGFDGVTVRDIAAEADVALGLISHHFKNKEGLRQAVDAYFLERASVAIERARRRLDQASLEDVVTYQQRWIQRYEDEWPSFAAYLRRALTDDGDWGRNLFKAYYDLVAQLFRSPQGADTSQPAPDPDWMPMIYMFIILGPILLHNHVETVFGKSPFEPEMWSEFQRALMGVSRVT